MKQDKEHRKETSQHHSVETPTPPQVMNPSVPPSKTERSEHEKPNKKKNKSSGSSDKQKKSEQEKLAPAEEL